MNKVAIGIVSGIGGCAVGSAVTYYILDKRLKDRYKKDTEEAKAFFARKYYSNDKDGFDNSDDADQDKAYNDYSNVRQQIQEQSDEPITINDKDYDRQRIIDSLDYHSKYGQGTKDMTEEDKEFEDAETERNIAEDSYSSIWLVTSDEFENEQDDNIDFERFDIIYLPEDDVLITPDGQVYADDKLEKYRQFIDRDIIDGELYVCDSDYREYYHISIDDRDYPTYMSDLG